MHLHLQSLFFHYLTLSRPLGYLLIFIGLMVEGEGMLFLTAFLTYAGFFDLGDVIIVGLTAVFLGDFLWYQLGAHLSEHYSFFRKWAERIAGPFDEHIKNRTFHTIFISKFVYGTHRPIQLRAGALRISLWEYMKSDIPAVFVWFFLVGGLGYLSSASFNLVRHYFRFAEFGLLIALIIFLTVVNLIARRSRKIL